MGQDFGSTEATNRLSSEKPKSLVGSKNLKFGVPLSMQGKICVKTETTALTSQKKETKKREVKETKKRKCAFKRIKSKYMK